MKDLLFDLCKSLNKAEKKNFSQHAAMRGGDKNYMKLFNALLRMERYDESKLRQVLSKESFSSNLANEKLRLKKILLKSLRALHEGSNSESEIRACLHDSDILSTKGLYEHALRPLKKAQAIAEKFENHTALLTIQQKERRIHFELLRIQGLKQYMQEAQLQDERLELIGNEARWWLWYAELSISLLEHGLTIRTLQEDKVFQDMRKKLFSRKDTPKTFGAKVARHYALSSYYRASEDVAGTYKNNKEHIALWQAHPHYVQNDPRRYLAILNNFLTVASHMGKEDEFAATVQQINALLANKDNGFSERLQLNTRLHAFIQRLHMGIVTGKFNEALDAVARQKDLISHASASLTNISVIILYFNLVYVCFGAGRFSEALQWSNKLQNETRQADFEYLHYFNRLINLLIHYELGNFDLLDYLILSLYRYMLKRKQEYRFERMFIEFIKKELPASNEPAKVKAALQKLHERLSDISKDPYEQRALVAFDMLSWLEAKATGRSFAKVVKAKVAGKK